MSKLYANQRGLVEFSSTNDNLMFLKRIFFLMQNQHEKRHCLKTVVNCVNHHENKQSYWRGRQTVNNGQ
jgi:hypothetical protein